MDLGKLMERLALDGKVALARARIGGMDACRGPRGKPRAGHKLNETLVIALRQARVHEDNPRLALTPTPIFRQQRAETARRIKVVHAALVRRAKGQRSPFGP